MRKFAATILFLVGFAGPAIAEAPSMGGTKMLIYGNYCGPGNNAPLPPIDALDAACAHHDACTPRHGFPSYACNARLLRDAETISRDPRQPDGLRFMADIIAAGAMMLEIGDGPASAPIAVSRNRRP